jgi:hypothetical protein
VKHAWEGREMHTGFKWETRMQETHLSVDVRIILKLILKA